MPDGQEDEQDVELILLDAEERMQKSEEALERDLRNIRSSRATPAMAEHISVEYYGEFVPLQQLANISVPEARMLIISPFDKSAMGDIEKAILKSDLNITPQNDGSIIRLILPELSMERRRELVKQVKGRVEEARVSIRNIRRDANDSLKKMTGSKGHSEDEIKDAQEDVQKLTDQFITKLEKIAEAKEKDILTV